MDGVKHYFGGGAAAMNLHERLADLLLMELSFSMEDPGISLSHPKPTIEQSLIRPTQPWLYVSLSRTLFWKIQALKLQ